MNNNFTTEDLYPKATGDVQIIIATKNQPTLIINKHNRILRAAKVATTNALINEYGDVYSYYIANAIVGTNGVTGGVPKVVEETRTALFGTTLLTKPVIASLDETTRSVFTFVIGTEDGNGNNINEMALVMANDELYSMITLGNIAKTSDMQLTINWYIRQS